MTGLGPLVRKELLEQWRTLRLPIVAVVFLLVGLSSPLLARFTPELVRALAGEQFQLSLPPPTVRDAVDQLLKNLGQFGALTAVLLAMGSVAGEKERGTAALILTKPASRGAFLAAKLVAIGATLGVATLVAGLGAWYYTLVLFEPLPVAGFAAALGLQWLVLGTYGTITFLGSTLTRSPAAAAGLGLAAILVLGIVGALPTVGRFVPAGLTEPARGLAIGAPAVDVAAPLVATALILVAALGASWLAFRRQEL